MARIILGSLITDIRGSIGGTTFRNVKGQFVASNKSSGIASSKTLNNKALLNSRRTFQFWQTLSDAERLEWKTLADANRFPNRFGVDSNLSPYNFFTKIMITNAVTGFGYVLPSTFTTYIEPSGCNLLQADSTAQKIEISFLGAYQPVNLLVQCYVVSNKSVLPIFNRRAFLFTVFSSVAQYFDFSAYYIAKYGPLSQGQTIRAVYYFQNSCGIRTTPQYLDCVVS